MIYNVSIGYEKIQICGKYIKEFNDGVVFLIKVMIVDDDLIVRKGLSQVIDWKALGADIVCLAGNGRIAADFLDNNDVDIVISDIKMPEMDGLELAQYIYEKNPKILVMLISAYGEFEYAQRAMHYNVKEYLLKPISMENIAHIKAVVSSTAIKKKSELQRRNYADGDFKQLVYKELFENNEAQLKELLGADLDIQTDNVDLVKEYYLNVMGFLSDLCIEHGIKYISKSTIVEAISRAEDIDTVKKYVNNTIHRLREVLNIDKNNNTKMLVIYITGIIESEYMHPELSVNELAERLGFDASYIGTVFKAHKDITITKYINSIRIKEACRLLRETSLPVKEISVRVGYSDPNYFSRKFREEMDMTPIEYR